MNMQIVEMQQNKAAIVAKMGELNKLVEKEGRDFTMEERERWETWEREVLRVDGAIARGEVQEKRESELAKAQRPGANGSGNPREENDPADYETSTALRPDQSVRSYMQNNGMIRQPEFEKLSFGQLLRAAVTGPRSDLERRALAEGTDSAGGYSVPDIVLARFIDKMRAQTVCIRSGAMTVPLNSDRSTICRTATDPAAGWRVENAAVALSDPTYEAVVFAPKSLAVIVKVSRELMQDSLNIEQMLEASFAGAMAVELDRVALVGSGVAPEPLGIYGTTNVGSVASVGTPADYGKFIDGLYELWIDNEVAPTAAILHPRTATTLAKLPTGIASDKTPLVKPAVLADIPFRTTTSLPINLGGGTNESIAILGNFSRLMFGVRSALRVEILRELYAANYQYAFIAHLRADVAVEHAESFCILSGITST